MQYTHTNTGDASASITLYGDGGAATVVLATHPNYQSIVQLAVAGTLTDEVLRTLFGSDAPAPAAPAIPVVHIPVEPDYEDEDEDEQGTAQQYPAGTLLRFDYTTNILTEVEITAAVKEFTYVGNRYVLVSEEDEKFAWSRARNVEVVDTTAAAPVDVSELNPQDEVSFNYVDRFGRTDSYTGRVIANDQFANRAVLRVHVNTLPTAFDVARVSNLRRVNAAETATPAPTTEQARGARSYYAQTAAVDTLQPRGGTQERWLPAPAARNASVDDIADAVSGGGEVRVNFLYESIASGNVTRKTDTITSVRSNRGGRGNLLVVGHDATYRAERMSDVKFV